MPEVELPNPSELEETKGKTFTRRVALMTGIFAVILAIASLGGSNAMKEMLLAQQQASDQWSYYQAKTIREHLYRSQRMRLEVDLLERRESMKPQVREQFESMLKKLSEEEARFGTEKKEIERRAKELEEERNLYRSKDPYFDYAEALLQIAIIMAGISILATSKRMLYFSLAFAVLGSICTLNGYFQFLRIPLLR